MQASKWAICRMAMITAFVLTANASPLVGANLGFKLGITSSDQSRNEGAWNIPHDMEAVLHSTFGAFVDIPVAGFHVVPTFNYVRYGREEGARFFDPALLASASVYDKTGYISVQADIQIPFKVGAARFYLLGAPRVNVLVDSDRSVVPDYYYNTPRPEDFNVPEYESTVAGIAVGVGQHIDVGLHTLVLEIRYDRDIEAAWTIPADEGVREPSDGHVYHRTVMIQLGLKLWTSDVKPSHEVTTSDHWLPVNAPMPE